MRNAEATFPTTIACVPMTAGTRPKDLGGLPTTNECSVSTTGDAPTSITSLPMNIVTFPTTAVGLPTDIDCLVLNTDNLPASIETSKMSGFGLFL